MSFALTVGGETQFITNEILGTYVRGDMKIFLCLSCRQTALWIFVLLLKMGEKTCGDANTIVHPSHHSK